MFHKIVFLGRGIKGLLDVYIFLLLNLDIIKVVLYILKIYIIPFKNNHMIEMVDDESNLKMIKSQKFKKENSSS